MADSTKEYEVTADGQLFLEFNDRGDVVNKKRLRRGDKVSLTQEQADRLLWHGGIKDPNADAKDADTESTPGDGDAATVTATGGGGESFPDQGFSADTEDTGSGDGTPDSTEGQGGATDGQDGGTPAPGSADEALTLRGEALDQALIDADLSTSGSADDRRKRLYDHRVATA